MTELLTMLIKIFACCMLISMKKIILLLLIFSKFTHANFVKTNMPFDMVAVGQDCYFKLSNNIDEYKYKKSVSLVANNSGVPLSLDGYFIFDLKITSNTTAIDIRENGDVFLYSKGNVEGQYHSTVELYNKAGEISKNEKCIIKQGIVYKIKKNK